jgi:hypothetical protein
VFNAAPLAGGFPESHAEDDWSSFTDSFNAALASGLVESSAGKGQSSGLTSRGISVQMNDVLPAEFVSKSAAMDNILR